MGPLSGKGTGLSIPPSSTDDIDSGWDDEPAPSSALLAPVAATPLPLSASLSSRAREGGTLRPSAFDARGATPPSRSRAPLFTVLLAAAVLAAGVVGWTRVSAPRQAPVAAEPAGPAEQVAPPVAPAAEPPQPIEARPEAPATVVATEPAAPSTAAAPPPAAVTEDQTLVTIKTVPAAAVLFMAGKRLGVGEAQVSVEPKTKRRLTALLDGHDPVNFIVDGSRAAITIMLKPARREAGAQERGDAEKPAPAAAPATEGATTESPSAEATTPKADADGPTP